jgi:hypothetical protein
MRIRQLLAGLIAPLILAHLVGCGPTIRVPVPPRVDLGAYPMVGLVVFTSNANHDLEHYCTKRFMQAVHAAQPGTRVIELGTEPQVLASVGARHWDAATLRAIKKMHGVDVVVMGELELKEVRPDIRISSTGGVSARADVQASLSAKLVETSSGASMWTDWSQVTSNIAHVRFNDRGSGRFGASNLDAVYGEMVGKLVHNITADFRTHYVTRRVSKEELRTTSATGPAVH